MGLNWSAFFQSAGSGLGDYAALMSGEADKKKAEARQALLDKQAAAELEYQHGQDREASIRATRKDYLDRAQHASDQFSKRGITVSPDYEQNAMQAQLPQASTDNGDVGSMAINALRNYGQSQNRQWETGISPAMNEGWKAGRMSTPIAGGGSYDISPDVLASLKNASATRYAADVQRGISNNFERTRIANTQEERRKQDAADNAEGLGILGADTHGQPELQKAFGSAYQDARSGDPTMAPGLLAKQTMAGLRSARPDLIPRAAGAEDPIAAALDKKNGKKPSSGTPVVAPRTPPPPIYNEAMAQRYDELTATGVDGEVARQQVLREFAK